MKLTLNSALAFLVHDNIYDFFNGAKCKDKSFIVLLAENVKSFEPKL